MSYLSLHLTLTMDYNKQLLEAAERENFELVCNALQNGADIEVKNHYGDTALHWAASNKNLAIAQLLLEKGANIETKDIGNNTPLHFAAGQGIRAARSGSAKMVRLLLKWGAPVNSKQNVLSRTPLHIAIQCAELEIVRILLSQPAITVNNSHLDLAKWTSKILEKQVFMKKESTATMGKIGCMLILHLGLTSQQFRISKNGIIGAYGCPPEIAAYIATFLHE
jgi:ankyrin repeat protein